MAAQLPEGGSPPMLPHLAAMWNYRPQQPEPEEKEGEEPTHSSTESSSQDINDDDYQHPSDYGVMHYPQQPQQIKQEKGHDTKEEFKQEKDIENKEELKQEKGDDIKEELKQEQDIENKEELKQQQIGETGENILPALPVLHHNHYMELINYFKLKSQQHYYQQQAFNSALDGVSAWDAPHAVCSEYISHHGLYAIYISDYVCTLYLYIIFVYLLCARRFILTCFSLCYYVSLCRCTKTSISTATSFSPS